MKKLYRSEENKIVWGILGGLGEYYNVDPVLIRLIFVVLMFATGIIPLLLAYIVLFFIVPEGPGGVNEKEEEKGNDNEDN